jgi:hypothetical protein
MQQPQQQLPVHPQPPTNPPHLNSSEHMNSIIDTTRSVVERKKAAIENLKNWDVNTKTNIQSVKSLVDNMFVALEEILARSFKRYEKIYNFFEKIKISMASEISFSEGADVFRFKRIVDANGKKEVKEETAIHESISQFDAEFKKFVDGFRMLQLKVKNQINSKILAENVKPYENNIKSLYVQVASTKKSLHKISLATTDKLEDLMKAIRENQSEVAKNKRPKTNIFENVNAFVAHVEGIAELVREYGMLFLKLYEESLLLEKYRINSIKESFLTYIKILADFFGKENDKNFQASQNLFQKLNETFLSEESLNLHLLMKPMEIAMVLEQTKSPALTVICLREFIAASKFYQPVSSVLENFYIKRYQCYLIETKETNNEVDIFLTNDHFYSVCKSRNKSTKGEVILSIPIEEVKINCEKGRDSLTFRYTEKFFLWNTKKKQTFLFKNNTIEEIIAAHEGELKALKTKITSTAILQQPVAEVPPGNPPTLSHMLTADSQLTEPVNQNIASNEIIDSQFTLQSNTSGNQSDEQLAQPVSIEEQPENQLQVPQMIADRDSQRAINTLSFEGQPLEHETLPQNEQTAYQEDIQEDIESENRIEETHDNRVDIAHVHDNGEHSEHPHNPENVSPN